MTIGILGYGNMGSALAAGLLREQPEVKIAIAESVPARRRWAVQQHDAIDCGSDIGALCESADVIVLAVPPDQLSSVGPSLAQHLGEKPVISLLGYVTLSRLSTVLSTQNVCRFMPNIAARVGEALVGIAYTEAPSETLIKAANDLANAIGRPMTLPERLIPAINGLSGSGIAFLLKFIHGACLGAVETGMRYEDALTAMLQVLRGTAELIDETGEHPIELVSKVATPNGSTIAGIHELDLHGFEGVVESGVVASALRAGNSEH